MKLDLNPNPCGFKAKQRREAFLGHDDKVISGNTGGAEERATGGPILGRKGKDLGKDKACVLRRCLWGDPVGVGADRREV